MAIINLQVSTGNDDAREDGTGAFFLDETSLQANSRTDPGSSGYDASGVRFQNVAIDQGNTITTAYIEVNVFGTGNDDANFSIYGNDVDDADDFNTEADIIGRDRTTASASWIEDSVAGGGTGWYGSTIDLTAVVQEIVDRASWVSGQNMVFLFIPNTDSSKYFAFLSYEEGTNINGPKLHMEWSNQPPVTPTNSSPVDAVAGVSLTPILESSAFSDPDIGDTHLASQWQVTAISGNYGTTMYDSGIDLTNLESVDVPSSAGLEYGTTYYWHVRHQDDNSNWSSYSTETSFTTLIGYRIARSKLYNYYSIDSVLER